MLLTGPLPTTKKVMCAHESTAEREYCYERSYEKRLWGAPGASEDGADVRLPRDPTNSEEYPREELTLHYRA